jgi:hypothetical protein
MPLRLVLDEQLRGPLWSAVRRHNAAGVDVIDVTRVGDPPDLLLGTLDPELLIWCEREGRVLVTKDWTTMPGHLAAHLQKGRHSPGILIPRPGPTLRQLAFFLALATYAFDPAEVQDQIRFIP